jgi:hypothetical protein
MAFDEMAVTIASQRFWLGRAVNDEREVFDLLALKACGEAGGHVPEWASDPSRRATLVARAGATLVNANAQTRRHKKVLMSAIRSFVADWSKIEKE